MSNTFSIYFDDDAPTNAAVEVADADNSWVTHSLQVRVSLRGPGSFTPTQVKVWGIDGITTESGASWQPMSATITGTLQSIDEEQLVYAKFWDSGSNYADATSSGVYYLYTAPRISSSVSWKTAPTDDGSNIGVLSNSSEDTELSLDKTKLIGLRFHDLDIRDLGIGSNGVATTITATSGSQIYQLVRDDINSYIPVTKTFASTSKVPFIRYNDGTGFTTITKYNRSVKTGYDEKIENVNWNSGTGDFTFDLLEFSSYGFAVIDKVEFTADSSSGGYNGASVSIKAKVIDTNGDGVEGAPVTFTIASGADIGNFSVNPVNTDANGIATATLVLDTIGVAYIDAAVDGVSSSPDSRVYCIAQPTALQRSLLTQYEQINTTINFDDDIASVNTSAVAEPENNTASGIEPDTLQHDTNVFRTLLKQIKGTANWYSELPTYTDYSDTASAKTVTLSGIKGHTLDSKTIILAVEDKNAGVGFTISSGTTGFLITPTDARYADPADRRGLPIFASTAHNGSYFDEAGDDEVCVIDLIDFESGTEFKTSGGDLIYAKFHDGSDFSGSGEGTDVYVRFYTNNTPYTWTASDPAKVMIVYPFRKVLSEMQEWEWMRTDFIGSFEGDAELIEDISNLWSFTGAVNHGTTPSWTYTGNGYAVISGSSLRSALDQINNVIGNTSYSGTIYITALDDIAESLVDLDNAIKSVSDSAASGVGEKYIETVLSDIIAGTGHTLPGSLSYTPVATSGQYGKNMDVFLDGQLLTASTGTNGGEEDMDYSETSTTSITFHRDVYAGSNITYTIKQ
jgi:hypothetical protein